jgi:release factor glutamine methyltransferase
VRTDSLSTALAEARRKLGNTDTETAALDARLLLQAATSLTHAQIIAEPQWELLPEQIKTFEQFITRRMAHEPVSRILGKREFYGREFIVTPEVLDPRADTECVVELALKLTREGRFVDLGTGSGAIAVTLCAENKNLSGIATDISSAALEVAKANAHILVVADRLQFHQAAWFEGLSGSFDLIISNPPYIKDDAKLPPDVASYDPHVALFGGADGLQAYRAIAQQCGPYLSENAHVVVELGFDQASSVAEIFAAHDFSVTSKAIDIAGFIRGLAFAKRR